MHTVRAGGVTGLRNFSNSPKLFRRVVENITKGVTFQFSSVSPYKCMGNVWWELTFVCHGEKTIAPRGA